MLPSGRVRVILYVVCPHNRAALLSRSTDGCWLPISVEVESEEAVPAALQAMLTELSRVIDLPHLKPARMSSSSMGRLTGRYVPWFRWTLKSGVVQYVYLAWAATSQLNRSAATLAWFSRTQLPSANAWKGRGRGDLMPLPKHEGAIDLATASQVQLYLWRAYRAASRTENRRLVARARRARQQPSRRRPSRHRLVRSTM